MDSLVALGGIWAEDVNEGMFGLVKQRTCQGFGMSIRAKALGFERIRKQSHKPLPSKHMITRVMGLSH